MDILQHIDWFKGDLNDNYYWDEQRNILMEFPYANSIDPNSCLNFAMGRNSYFQSGVLSPNVIIGRYCSISHNVHLGASQHPLDHLSTGILNMNFKSEPIKSQNNYTFIGSDVWIGLNAVIMSGVKVGHGAVIGAGAIVTKDVPPYCIVGGVPAKPIKYRFDEQIIQDLLESKWWELHPMEIELLPKNDIHACIRYFKEKKSALNL